MPRKREKSAEWSHALHTSDNPQLEALGALLQPGSRFMIEAAESSRSWCIVDRSARSTAYYWRTDSPSLLELIEQSKLHNFETDAPSWSRLCKHIYNNEVSDEISKVKPHPFYKGLAEQKWHWHKTRAIPGFYHSISELDIKSAYATAIQSQDSLLRESRHRSVDDGGAMERFRTLFPTLSKKLRLAMVGWLCANRLDILCPPKAGTFLLRRETIYKCHDGGVFNSMHHGIYALHSLMAELGEIGGNFIPRIHTDSLWIDERIPSKLLIELLDRLDNAGYHSSIKGHGMAILFDLNSAVLGGHIVGMPSHTAKLFDAYKAEHPEIDWQSYPLDGRLTHLPYKNERISLRQHRLISDMMSK